MNRTFILLAIAGVVGILGGGVLGNYLRGQPVNWFIIGLNVVLVGGIFYLISHKNKKDTEIEEAKTSWAERSERKKKKKRK